MTNKSKKIETKPAQTTTDPKKKRPNAGRPTKEDALVKQFQALEFDFNFAKEKKTPAEKLFVKGAAEMLLLQGVSPYKVAQIVHIHYTTAQRWFDEMPAEKKRQSEESLLKFVSNNVATFLNSSLVALANVAEICSSKEYLMKHNPADIASLFEQVGNQAFRLIEARQRHQLAEKEAELIYKAQAQQHPRSLASHQTTPTAPQTQTDQTPTKVETILKEGENL